MTSDRFRELALSIPGASESAHMNHPDFRIEGKTFATLGAPDENWAMVKLTPEQQGLFMERAPDVFRPCAGVGGQRGATNVHLASARTSVVQLALEAARRNIAGGKGGPEE